MFLRAHAQVMRKLEADLLAEHDLSSATGWSRGRPALPMRA